MSCVLRIAGIGFQVDAYLAATGLAAIGTWKTGDQRGIRGPAISNGCNIDVSNADFNDLKGQIRDAIKFLRDRSENLKRLPDFGLLTSDEPELDFGIDTRMHDVGAQFDYFPNELLKLCGDLGLCICLSQYQPSSEEDQSEDEL
ncbi:MAG: hypothetical protein JNM91_06380 [Flavobacteriales bacterium]|nr:hypothetical protein [Flavobacteriales bacterium]